MLIPFLLFLFIPSLLALIAVLFLLLYIALYRAPSTTRRTSLGRSAAVVVLGDVGRSPRMCYHVESLADQGWKVSVVGYGGSKLPNSIQRSSVKFHKLSEVPPWVSKLPRAAFILVAPFKLLWQSVGLFFKVTMTIQPPPEVIFVQTPPALPTLFIVRICSLLLSSRIVIDWHNLGYTILSLRLGKTSPLVSFARTLERMSGRNSFAHLFVTHAMKRHLEKEWQLQGHKAVLHDRPPKHFKKASIAESHALWTTLAPKLQPSLQGFLPASIEDPTAPGGQSATPFTKIASSTPPKAAWRADRPALAVSSTSWTADEDFGLLLRAAQLYEKRAREVNAGRMMSDPYPPGRQPISFRASFASGPSNPDDSSALYETPRNSLEQSQSLGGGAYSAASNLSPPRSHSPTPGYADPSMPASGSRAAHRNRRPSLQSMRSCTLPNIPAQRLPKLLIIVTGKGELRAKYEREIAQLEKQEGWEYVRIRTAWLETWEYPLLLGSADVGISLHTSSSGLDLPMKVVDMLGCHLPVLALDFPCLDELIQHGRNGLTFSDEGQLCDGFESLLADFPRYGTLTGDGQNWLARGGGLKDPFAYAGRQADPGSQSDSVASTSQDAPLTRQSLEANSALDEMDERKRLSRTSLDFSKGGLPTSNSFGSTSASTSAHASAVPSPSGSLWGIGEHLAGASPTPPRPVTPTPTFTMLASPLLGPSSDFPDCPDSLGNAPQAASPPRQSTWTANWKATVRPILRLADEEDAKAEGTSLSDEEDADDPDSTSQDDELSRLLGSGARDETHDLPSFPSLTTPKRRRRRLGADGKPLRVRGGSVQGLLWSEDFADMRRGAGALVGSDEDEDDDELERDLGFLGSLGIVSPRAGDHRPGKKGRGGRGGSVAGPTAAQAKLLGMALSPVRSAKDSSGKKGSPSSSGSPSPPLTQDSQMAPGTGTGQARRMASLASADSIPFHVSSHDSDARRGHLRQRTAAAAGMGAVAGDSTGSGAGGVGAGIPDIWVSQVEGDGSVGR